MDDDIAVSQYDHEARLDREDAQARCEECPEVGQCAVCGAIHGEESLA